MFILVMSVLYLHRKLYFADAFVGIICFKTLNIMKSSKFSKSTMLTVIYFIFYSVVFHQRNKMANYLQDENQMLFLQISSQYFIYSKHFFAY